MSLVKFVDSTNILLATKATGALANLALDPESKTLIANTPGTLQRLVYVSGLLLDPNVLHQVCRCMFSLATNKSIAGALVRENIFGVIPSLIVSPNANISGNAIGCLGNIYINIGCLCGIYTNNVCPCNVVYLDLILPMFKFSTNSFLIHQAARVLFRYSSERHSIPRLVACFDDIVNRFLTSATVHVVFYLAGVINNVVAMDPSMAEWFNDKEVFPRCIWYLGQYARQRTVPLGDLCILCTALSKYKHSVAWVESNIENAKVTLFNLASVIPQVTDQDVSVNVLKCIAGLCVASPSFASVCRDRHSLLELCLMTVFEHSSDRVRKQAALVLSACTKCNEEVFFQIGEFGGKHGEERRHKFNLGILFQRTFTIHDDNNCTEGCDANRECDTGLKWVTLGGSSRYHARVFTPIIDSQFPGFLDNPSLRTVEATKSAWSSLFELISTGDAWGEDVETDHLREVKNLAATLGLNQVSSELETFIKKHEEETVLREDKRFKAMISFGSFSLAANSDIRFVFPSLAGIEDDDDFIHHVVILNMLSKWNISENEEIVIIPAQTRILACRSEFFQALFSDNGKPPHSEVRLNVKLGVFLLLLRYMYFGIDNDMIGVLSRNTGLAVMACQMAVTYQLPGLQLFCEYCLVKAFCLCGKKFRGYFAEKVVYAHVPLFKLYLVVCSRKKDSQGDEIKPSTLEKLCIQSGLKYTNAAAIEDTATESAEVKKARFEETAPESTDNKETRDDQEEL